MTTLLQGERSFQPIPASPLLCPDPLSDMISTLLELLLLVFRFALASLVCFFLLSELWWFYSYFYCCSESNIGGQIWTGITTWPVLPPLFFKACSSVSLALLSRASRCSHPAAELGLWPGVNSSDWPGACLCFTAVISSVLVCWARNHSGFFWGWQQGQALVSCDKAALAGCAGRGDGCRVLRELLAALRYRPVTFDYNFWPAAWFGLLLLCACDLSPWRTRGGTGEEMMLLGFWYLCLVIWSSSIQLMHGSCACGGIYE